MQPRQADRGGPLEDLEDARGVAVPLRPELILVSTGATSSLLALVAISREGQGLSGCGRPLAVPHPRHACQTQRRTAAGWTPSTRATSPTGRPAPTSPTAWTRTAVGSVDHDPPPSRPIGPPEDPGRFGSGVDPPPLPPLPRCVLPSAAPAGLGGAGRVPVRVAVRCPTGVPMAAVAAGPVVAGSVGGCRRATPAPQRSPRSAPAQAGGQPHRPAAAPRR